MNNFYKIVLIIFVAIFGFTPAIAQDVVLQAGVTVEELPKAIFGNWSVKAKIVDSTNYKQFKPKSTDLWNLSRNGDVLNLSNPFTGANADVSINAAEGNVVSFTRVVDFDNKRLTDIVIIRLEDKTFSGINNIKLEQHSLLDGHVIKTDTARYEIKGEKISGGNILEN